MATKTTSLDARVTTLEEQMAEVLAKPAFRRKTENGVCAKGHPDSNVCPEASLGRMQGGCHGFACLGKQQDYYKTYRARRKAEKAAEGGTPVPTPRKRSTATTAAVAKKAGTIKRAAKKAAAPKLPAKRIKRRGQQ